MTDHPEASAAAPLDLRAIQARLKELGDTPPWFYETGLDKERNGFRVYDRDGHGVFKPTYGSAPHDRAMADFLLHARSDIPALLAAVGDLTARLREHDRLVTQAQAISALLAEANVGACPLTEGVRLLLNRAEQAEADHAALTARLQQQQGVIRLLEVALRDMEFNHGTQLREAHAIARAALPVDDSDLPTIEEASDILGAPDPPTGDPT